MNLNLLEAQVHLTAENTEFYAENRKVFLFPASVFRLLTSNYFSII